MKRKSEPAPMATIHKIQAAIHDETKGMTVKEKVAYYRRARKELQITIVPGTQRRKTA